MVEAGTALLAPPESAVGAGSPYVQVRTLAGSGANFGISNGMAADARFDQALAMALDGAGNLYVADDGFAAIRRVSPSGETSTIAGGVLNGFGDGAGNVAEFATMYGIAVTTDGTVCYVCDSTNNRIRRLALTSGADPTNSANWTVTTIAGTGAGGGNYTTPKPGNTATLTAPAGLVLDPTGDLFFTEVYGNRVRRLTFQGGDPSLAANWQVTLLAGNTQFASGNAGTTDNTNGTLATFNEPSGLAIDRASRLYVADSGNDRVRVVTIDGATSTLAGGVSGTPPEAEYADGPGATALFDSPVGVAVDSAGYVYVAEDVGNRIRMVSPSGNVTTIAGSPTTAAGVAGYLDGLGNVALFNQPFAVAVDPAGTLYVGEIKNHAIRTIQRVISAGTD
jgi:sugar lactone lactonase YvrE